MRILFLNPSGQLGGAETSLLTLIEGLRRQRPDWDLHLVAAANGPLLSRATAAGVHATVLPFPERMALLGDGSAGDFFRALPDVTAYGARLRKITQSSQANVIHTNGFKMHLLGGWVAPSHTVLCHLHDYLGARRVSSKLMQASFGRYAAIVANSKSVAADLPARVARKVNVIHNGVDTMRFAPAGSGLDLDAQCGFEPAANGTVRVGLVATFANWKGHFTFLQAMAAIPATAPIRGYIIGAPIYQTGGSQHTLAELTSEAGRLGVSDRVGFTGFVADPAAAMRSLDVVVHASTRPEPFGMVIIEAMACGKAVIASRAGGATEIFDEGVTALGHAPGDARSLAEQILRLATQPQLRTTLGERARAAAVARFSAEQMAERFIRVYHDVALRAVCTLSQRESFAA